MARLKLRLISGNKIVLRKDEHRILDTDTNYLKGVRGGGGANDYQKNKPDKRVYSLPQLIDCHCAFTMYKK